MSQTLETLRADLKRDYSGRRYGKPRTDAERRKRHKSLYNNTDLPPRGTRLALLRMEKGKK